MLKRFLLLTIATLVMLPVLADKPDDTGNKGGSSVLLYVEFCEGKGDPVFTDFAEQPCDLDVYNFASDKKSPKPYLYIDSEQSVSTAISKFRFGLNVGLYGTRHFRLDLRNAICAPVPNCTPPNLVNDLTYGWNVFAISPDGAQYLKMGFGDAHSQLVNFQLEFFDTQNRDQNWRIMFNPSLCPVSPEYPVKMATVTRIADDIWVFEAGAEDYACLELRKGGRKHYTYHGLYKLPFKIIATALQ